MLSKRVAAVGKNCVSCGACALVCPKGAIAVYKGMFAKVDLNKCIGCGKCYNACPSGVIEMVARGVDE